MDAYLEALAHAHGVACWYRDGERRRVDVDAEVVVTVLGLLGVDASTPSAVRHGLAAVRERWAAGRLPGTVALRSGRVRPLPGPGVLVDEDGRARVVDDALPADLPAGWYTLRVGEQEATVVVPPPRLPEPPSTWGWMLQLYALRSAGSWGMGDLADLRSFVQWTGGIHGAGAVLVNPLHAVTPVEPVQPSPYLPSSRRFANPLYLRVKDVPSYGSVRAEVDALRPSPGVLGGARIDHDEVWRAKRAALELLWRAEGSPSPEALKYSEGLRDFATFCALAEQHGPHWRQWPAELRQPGSPATARGRAELVGRVAFHAWVQQQCDRQLAAVRSAAEGMAVGVVHDLAVGVDPEGADAWALQDVLASGVTVGAPPDAFSQQGQDWGLAPWRPDRLDATGYAAYRDMLRAVLAHADGLRIDHVMGLWRLWWVPPGATPDRGTYVRYDAEVMLAVLALEAHRAGAMVVGEDLGTVEPEVTQTLHEHNMLGSAVLWFARDENAPGRPLLAASRWPSRAAASISTHDLPTASGFLRGGQVRVRAELGLLADVAAEHSKAAAQRQELLDLLRVEGLLGAPEPSEEEVVLAMHALLARTPCRLRLVSPYDVVGEVRQPNLPGTQDEYPNWRLPLPVTLEELEPDPRVARVVTAIGGKLPGTGTSATPPPARQ
ncbi:MAG: 4-alpha-glucanotransferase [Pseudonocardiaceae bacterium]